jgi:hypothetical protein
VVARLASLCARLYAAETPQQERRDLSLEVSVLRASLGCTLEAMIAASGSDDECEATS